MKAPDFWHRPDGGLMAALLSPVGCLYAIGARTRQANARPWRAPVPVICVGNLVAGGAGKTPVALGLAEQLKRRNKAVHFLSRGYGGSVQGPHRVDPINDSYRQVGDEPLLLAATAPTWVARDRAAGARAAIETGAEVIVMDDGFQNPSLAKDISLLVVDGSYGFGNGRIIPAGPLREPMADGLARADGVILIGADEAGVSEHIAAAGMPLFKARFEAGPEAAGLKGETVVAFAGIGRPEKFFATLEEVGCTLAARHAFADHHPYTPAEIAVLIRQAEAKNAKLVTTAKDAQRLAPQDRDRIKVLTITPKWEDEEALNRLLATLEDDARTEQP